MARVARLSFGQVNWKYIGGLHRFQVHPVWKQPLSGYLKNTIEDPHRWFKSTKCGNRLYLSGYLKTHERTHRGEKQFKCTKCGNRFSLSGYMKKHEIIYTSNKQFKCTKCRNRFYLLGYLETHECTYPGGENSFKKTKCVNRFSLFGSLKTHEMMTHMWQAIPVHKMWK